MWPPRLSRPLASALGWVGTAALVAAVVVGSRSMVQQRARLRFDAAVADARSELEERLRLYENLLRATRGFIQATGQLTREKARAFLSAEAVKDRFPGLLGIVYGRAVREEGAEPTLRDLRREHGLPDLQAWPSLGHDGDTLLSYAEPEAPSRAAFGFNSAVTPEQASSLRLARDTGRLQATPPLTLAQAPGQGPGVVLRLAAYDTPEVPPTVEARRAHYIGCINASFLVGHLAEQPRWALDQLGIHMQLLAEDGRPLLDRKAPAPGLWQRLRGGDLTSRVPFSVGDTTWTIRATALPGFLPAQEAMLPWLLGLLTLQTGWILSRSFRRLRRAREHAQGAMEASASRLQAITRVMPDAMLVLDEEGTYREILSRDPSLLAAPMEVLLGRRVPELLPRPIADRAMGAIRTALAEDRVVDLDYELATLAGPKCFEARIAPMDHPFEGRRCVLWVARDATERHRERQALFDTQKMESLGLLAGGIAHDFNNLLSAVLGYLTLARMDVKEQHSPEASFDRAEGAIRRAADLAKALLTYSGRGRPAIELLDLNRIVEDMADLLAVSRSKKVALQRILTPDLPPLLGDRVQLQQVVMNLVVNAGEALGDRPGTVRIQTGLRSIAPGALTPMLREQGLSPGPYISLVVEDDGIGMAPEVLARIFDPFFTTKATGHGLGLSAIRGILKSHRGGIQVQSTPGVGTRFEILLPAVTEEAQVREEAEAAASARVALKGLLLLAEDEPGIRESTARLLEHLGMQVLEAPDGESARALFEVHRESLVAVMLDPGLGGPEGSALVHTIREQRPGLPLLLCSANPPQEDSPSAFFLQKPYTYAQVTAALRRMLT